MFRFAGTDSAQTTVIERVPSDVFVWRGYPFTYARDALAAAKRVEKA
jgi:hypothetical protein